MNRDVGERGRMMALPSSSPLLLPTLVALLVIVATSVINRVDTIPITSTQPHSINMLLLSSAAATTTYELLCEEREAVKYLDNGLVHRN